MLKYVARRLLIMIPIMLGITVLVYMLASLCPGSPLTMLLQDPQVSAADIEAARTRYGLDQPIIVQYLRWLQNCLSGNLGYSYRTGEPVTKLIGERIVPTLVLTLTGTGMAMLLAIPLGVLAAYKPYSCCDYVASGLSFLGAASPSFFVGLIFIYLFSVKLGILPTGGMYSNLTTKTLLDYLRHLILPASVLMFSQMGMYIRQTRSSLLEVLGEDYIRTARSKGLREDRVVILHGLRNAFIPVVTQFGLSIPTLIGGTVVIEQVFSWPGLGTLMVFSIQSRDYPTIMGITVVVAFVVMIGNMLIELLYGVLDPRIRYQ